ncbi:MAG: hypothetical protein HC828_22135 [Blastochloris sp.]|nr:hypothetical protein [Blastochloris sp.]
MRPYTYTLNLAQLSPSDSPTILVRIESDPWVPARIRSDPPSNDVRSLGVQFGGLAVID